MGDKYSRLVNRGGISCNMVNIDEVLEYKLWILVISLTTMLSIAIMLNCSRLYTLFYSGWQWSRKFENGSYFLTAANKLSWRPAFWFDGQFILFKFQFPDLWKGLDVLTRFPSMMGARACNNQNQGSWFVDPSLTY